MRTLDEKALFKTDTCAGVPGVVNSEFVEPFLFIATCCKNNKKANKYN